jgi:hypothetical protein
MRALLGFCQSFWRLYEAMAKRNPLWGPRERAFRLLVDNLSATQRQQFARHGFFEVIGGKTGTTYRIREGHFLNVECLDAMGRCSRVLCFGPEGNLPLGDVLLAQKLALELLEADALMVANALAPSSYMRARYSGLADRMRG